MEEHNLARQNFIAPDIGKNKAQVLAQRYGNSFGVNIGFIPKYLRSEEFGDILDFTSGYFPVYVSCVDNNKTRNLIHQLYRQYTNLGIGGIYLDSGNEEYAGQVVFSTLRGSTINAYNLTFSNSRKVEDAVELFDMKPDDRHPDDLSWAERAVHSPQNIATNIMAANVLFNYCNAILCATAATQDISPGEVMRMNDILKGTRAISAHVTYFNAKTGTISTQPFNNAVTTYIEKYRMSREAWIVAEKVRLKEIEDARRQAEPETADEVPASATETAEQPTVTAEQVTMPAGLRPGRLTTLEGPTALADAVTDELGEVLNIPGF